MRSYLLLDDNLAFAENLAEILRDQGDEATVVTEGGRALSLAATRRFHALLTDMKMPGMSGATAVRHIRQVDPGLAVVVITAWPGQDELEAVRQEGLLAVLPKPVPLAPLVSLLERARRDGLVVLVQEEPGHDARFAEVLRSRGFSCVSVRTVADAERLRGLRLFAALVASRSPGERVREILDGLRSRLPGLPVFFHPMELLSVLDVLERAHDSR